MHSSGERPAKHHTCSTIETQSFKLCFTLFALCRYFTDANLIADNFNWLCTLRKSSVEIKKNNYPIQETIIFILYELYFNLESVNNQLSTYSGNSPSTRQTYSLSTCLFRICCSISLAFLGFLPNIKRPEVKRSKR